MSRRKVQISALVAVLTLSVISVACDGPKVWIPTPPPVELNYTISGAVTEMTAGGPMPVQGMRVALSASTRAVLTDASGFYSFPGITTSTGSVSATKDGYITVTTPFTAAADTRLDIRVARVITYTLSGMAYELTAAGRIPIPGIALYCDACGSPTGHTDMTTDADGHYSFSWVRPGTTTIIVYGKEGYLYVGPISSQTGPWPTVSITTPGDTRVDFEFVRR